MNCEEDILAAHGFTKAQCNRAIAKQVHKRSEREQALIVALVSFRKDTNYYG